MIRSLGAMRARFTTYLLSLHPAGLIAALVFFAWSMTPSLLPRAWYLQAVATGISIAIGYGVGALLAWIVRACGFEPQWQDRTRRAGWWILTVLACVLVPTFLVLGSWWQQIIRDLVGVPRVARSNYILVLALSLFVAALILTVSRAVRAGARALGRFGGRFIPAPIAKLASVVLIAVLAVLLVNGAVHQGIVAAAQRSAEVADQSTADGVEQPTAPQRSGSPASAEAWSTLGREGRTFVAGGPSAERIAEVTGAPAMTPIRTYAGRESADTVDGIAARVVAELERTGAFDRQILAVVTTTGRGWVNSNVASAFEYVNHGNSAIAAMQYSFLPSALSFVADRETPQIAGRALFDAVHQAWSARPEGSRPKLVVFGESLGSYGGQAAFASGADIVARTDGALLVGTPNFAQPWQRITDQRDNGSPERLPVVDDGRNIRFASRPDDADLPTPWESSRVVFWQHASDPITWWSFNLALHQPDWLREPLGPDVDPGMRWIPLVTFWQVTLDMVFSADVPSGFGHAYGPEAIDLWTRILTPQGWDDATTDRVRTALGG